MTNQRLRILCAESESSTQLFKVISTVYILLQEPLFIGYLYLDIHRCEFRPNARELLFFKFPFVRAVNFGGCASYSAETQANGSLANQQDAAAPPYPASTPPLPDIFTPLSYFAPWFQTLASSLGACLPSRLWSSGAGLGVTATGTWTSLTWLRLSGADWPSAPSFTNTDPTSCKYWTLIMRFDLLFQSLCCSIDANLLSVRLQSTHNVVLFLLYYIMTDTYILSYWCISGYFCNICHLVEGHLIVPLVTIRRRDRRVNKNIFGVNQ